jgi:tetratricopeptide (TPR) repeat protein
VITKKVPQQKRVFFQLVVLASLLSPCAFAAPLEDISLSAEKDRVVATIKLSGPIANVRYSPDKKGTVLNILLDKLPDGLATEEWIDNEVRKSPPSHQIPSFTVKTNLKQIQPKLIIEFSREAEYTVQMGRDGRSILVGIKIDQALPKFEGKLPTLPEIKPLPANASDINKQAAALMLQGRNAMAASEHFAAIDAFNKLLLLPPNDYSQEGQEWVGVARERAGQRDKARLEYDLYLKLYTTGEGVERVKIRLSQLGAQVLTPPPSVTAEQRAAKARTSQSLSYGSISMHYYRGASKVDTRDTVSQFSNPLSESTFSALDQSALITSVNMTERFISEKYDNRIVFNDTAFTNYLQSQSSRNRLNSAYYEVKNRVADYSLRVGRQSSTGGGVLGRFDGASVDFSVTSALRVKGVAGQLSDYAYGEKPVFYGISADMGPVTVYAIEQTVEDVSDRKAVGTELRYFDATKSAFSMFDFDTSYSVLNVAMFQGSFNATPDQTFNLYLDHRRAPYMSTRNALMSASTAYLTDLMQFLTEEEIRALAAARTGTSNLMSFGMTQRISPKWQVGGDIRVSNYDGFAASGTIDPATQQPTLAGVTTVTPGTGNELAFSPQLIGSNLFSSRDSTVISMSYISSAAYKAKSFYVYSRANVTDKWSLDASLQLYWQNYDTGVFMNRVMPMLRTAYQIRQSVSLEMDAGIEISHTDTGTQISDSNRQFFSAGFRWDF